MILQVKDLQIGYETPLLSNLNFGLDIGDRLVLFGANGCGKTTLLKALVDPQLQLQGKAQWQISRQEIGVLSQDNHFHQATPDFVEDYLYKCLLQFQPFTPRSRYKKEVMSLMEALDLVNQPLRVLSGGQRQKLKLARVLLTQSKALLLDEPLNAVDASSKMEIMKTLKALMPTTLQIWVLHDYYEIQQLQAPVLWIQEGESQLFSFEGWFKKVDQAFHSWMKIDEPKETPWLNS